MAVIPSGIGPGEVTLRLPDPAAASWVRCPRWPARRPCLSYSVGRLEGLQGLRRRPRRARPAARPRAALPRQWSVGGRRRGSRPERAGQRAQAKLGGHVHFARDGSPTRSSTRSTRTPTCSSTLLATGLEPGDAGGDGPRASVVATRAGGIPDKVGTASPAACRSRRREALAAALADLALDAPRRRVVGPARQPGRVESEFAWGPHRRARLALYHSLL